MDLESSEFYGGELVSSLKAAGWTDSYVEQTGGGTATIYARKIETEEYILGGPGSFNWNDPSKSVFTTDEFVVGEDQFDLAGEEKDHDPFMLSVETDASPEAIVAVFEQVHARLHPPAG